MKKDLEELKHTLQSDKDNMIRPDDSKVIIAQMQINALLALATDKNRAFSQIRESEKDDVAKCLVWSSNILPSITKRLDERKIVQPSKKDNIYDSIILINYIKENIEISTFVDRKREGVYLEGLKALAPKNIMMDEPKRTIMNRLI